MDCRGRDYALFRVRTPVILSARARLGTARVSAYGGQAGGLFPNMAATCLLLFRTRWIPTVPSSRALLVCLGVEKLDHGARIQTFGLLCLPVVFYCCRA